VATTPDQNVPLAVDLDGTLIRTDMMWESLAQLLRRTRLRHLPDPVLVDRAARAHLKQKTRRRAYKLDPAALP